MGLKGLPTREFPEISDYSLQRVRSRPAKVGDKLTTLNKNEPRQHHDALEFPDGRNYPIATRPQRRLRGQQRPKGYPESYPKHPIGDLLAAFIWLSY